MEGSKIKNWAKGKDEMQSPQKRAYLGCSGAAMAHQNCSQLRRDNQAFYAHVDQSLSEAAAGRNTNVCQDGFLQHGNRK